MTASLPEPLSPGAPSGLWHGIRYLGRGLGIWGRRPHLMLLGALPALLVSGLLLGALVTLSLNATSLAELATPFAANWSAQARDWLRVVVAVALVAAGVGLSVLTFTGLTLVLGAPVYDQISASVERLYGGVRNEVRLPWSVQLWRMVSNGLRLLGVSLVTGLLVLLVGLVPVVGAVAGPVTAAVVGAWALAVELVGAPCDARGLSLSQRRCLLRRQRWTSLGFGLACYLLFLVPLGAVIATPAAVAGATLLVRDQFMEPTHPGSPGAPGPRPAAQPGLMAAAPARPGLSQA